MVSKAKKFEVTGTVEDLPRSGRLATATTAEHRTELVASIAESSEVIFCSSILFYVRSERAARIKLNRETKNFPCHA